MCVCERVVCVCDNMCGKELYVTKLRVTKLCLKLDDGWPESVEEQSLLLLVWRH